MENPSEQTIVIQNLSFAYPKRATKVLDDINLTIKQGEFLVLCGPSGCGKTTLLRQLKPSLAPHGELNGNIYFDGVALAEMNKRDVAAKIGFVLQNPENQTVTDKVWHELAFGLESLGFDTPTIRLRVAEMASFFGIQTWFYKNVSELSGGQKQLLALASVMTLQPSVLILDEPTSQLDPVAATDFLATVGKINRELGVTIIITEHRLEEALPLANRVVVMDDGKIICNGTATEVGEKLRSKGHGMFAAMPVPMRVWAGVPNSLECPITVRDGREWITKLQEQINNTKVESDENTVAKKVPVIEIEDAWFKYDRNGSDIVKGLSFKAYAGELTAILGGNGTGKTTTLSLIAGLNRPYRGEIKIEGTKVENIPSEKLFNKWLGVLPQNPQALFVAKTVKEDLLEILTEQKLNKAAREDEVQNVAKLCRLTKLLDSHPYDLSGGEQQRAALAKILLLKPRILLLDEPTKGFDAEFKINFAAIIRKLTDAGVAVIMVSHDIEFCAEYADFCALFFDGNIVTENTPREFFSGNSFYTSAANRMARHLLPTAVTANDIVVAMDGKPTNHHSLTVEDFGTYSLEDEATYEKQNETYTKLSSFRISISALAAIAFIFLVVYIGLHWEQFKAFISGGQEAINIASDKSMAWKYTGIMLGLAVSILTFIISVAWKREQEPWVVQTAVTNRKLSKRTLAATALILIAIPLTIYIGIFFFGDRRYYLISMLIIFETLIPFALVFEERKPQARELIIIAVLCAIGVAGRTAFFMLPQFKPVVAIVIIAGVSFGGEAGFLVGAMTGFVSNVFFGQGPWTPWQMFAFGIIGFLAGVLFKKGLLLRSKVALCTFGGLATFIIYGGIMNPAAVLMYQNDPKWQMFLAAYLQGIPFDLVHAFATVVFLAILSRPMLEKLDRIKVKYGLIE